MSLFGTAKDFAEPAGASPGVETMGATRPAGLGVKSARLERATAALEAVRREYRDAYAAECEARERRTAAEAALLLALRRVERLTAEEHWT